MSKAETARAVRVLVVDDSAYVRKVVRDILDRRADIEVVGTARDGREALDLVERLRPDVVTLDLLMPNMDGIEFLKAQMVKRPVPAVIVSITQEGGELALRALDAGAIDFVQKPTALATERLFELGDELASKVKAAASVNLAPAVSVSVRPAAAGPSKPLTADIVVVAVSTGGPQALKALVPALPKSFPVPIAIVLHMPVGYTAMYAEKLGEESELEVREAAEGDELRPGVVLVAPAGRHLKLERRDSVVRAKLDVKPLDSLHRPSADVLFESAADAYGQRVLGVVMTGMGSDGTRGAAWIKSRGGRVLTESQDSCVVYGMPRSVVEKGLSDRALPLSRLAEGIMEEISGG